MTISDIKRNWQTSSTGIGTLIAVAVRVWMWSETMGWPAALDTAMSDPIIWGLLFLGGQGLASKDGGVTGTAAKPDPSLLNVTVGQKPDPDITVVIEQPSETKRP